MPSMASLARCCSASSALEKIAGVLATSPRIADPADPVRLNTVRGEVALRDVTFGYLPDHPVLTGMNLTVPADQTPHIQEVHAMIVHLLCRQVERQLFPVKAP